VTANPIRRLEIDGEVFEVTTRPELPGQVDVAWLSGPNPDYGFSSRRSSGRHTDAELRDQIRDFLADINPETGYLE
jgi:ABC-type phosphate/phosphonate transport system substrate-binding protein